MNPKSRGHGEGERRGLKGASKGAPRGVEGSAKPPFVTSSSG